MGANTEGFGHNSDAAKRLRAFYERIERLEAERKAISDDVREVFAELKLAGFDVKVARAVLRRRKLSAAERDEQDQLIALYEGVFG